MFGRLCGFGALAYLILSASSAWALDTGQCLPAAQVRATLAAENQNAIIVGNRSGYGYPVALVFTSDARGSRGYALRSDKPLGEQGATICVESVYRDVKLNDITRPGIPAWAQMGGDPKLADAICKRDKLGYQETCNFADASLVTLNGNGQRVMLMASGTAINPRDKSVRYDQRIIVTVDAARQGGLLKAVTPEGSSYLLSAYSSASYTQHGTAMLDKK